MRPLFRGRCGSAPGVPRKRGGASDALSSASAVALASECARRGRRAERERGGVERERGGEVREPRDVAREGRRRVVQVGMTSCARVGPLRLIRPPSVKMRPREHGQRPPHVARRRLRDEDDQAGDHDVEDLSDVYAMAGQAGAAARRTAGQATGSNYGRSPQNRLMLVLAALGVPLTAPAIPAEATELNKGLDTIMKSGCTTCAATPPGAVSLLAQHDLEKFGPGARAAQLRAAQFVADMHTTLPAIAEKLAAASPHGAQVNLSPCPPRRRPRSPHPTSPRRRCRGRRSRRSRLELRDARRRLHQPQRGGTR